MEELIGLLRAFAALREKLGQHLTQRRKDAKKTSSKMSLRLP